ncbi:zinc finger BED domain-containing protein RICESLEEPER 2-like [Papaver somniferum]|uniref:zinc finger BED domain-containing protein RICESLEEPER 2-like n=1 Tax=Papaver somniferum TaxID=3469 RepID=UPI000E6FC79E|nr:zinc finger BED domain-containing protein RICESLEEPER 2-like [Papaver somniferum]
MSVEEDHDDVMSEEDITVVESMTSQEHASKKRKFTSKVWNDFHWSRDKDGKEKATCKNCRKEYAYDSQKGGTSTMSRHLKKCPRLKMQDVGQLLLSTNNGELATRARKIDQSKFRDLVARLIIGKNLPFNCVEWTEFRELCSYLNVDVETISRNTTRSDILKMHKFQKEVIRKKLQCSPGKMCLTSDMWTSVNTTGYISLTVHFVDQDWVLQKFLLNFSPLPPPHTGQALSDKLFLMLNDWGIEGKVTSITLDNAASNTSCVKIMKSRFIARNVMSDTGKRNFHIRICAHIINLIVRDGLTEIDPAVIKIRLAVKYLKGSQRRKQNFLDTVSDLGMSVKMGVRQDVKTRWNSTYLMLQSCISYEKVFTHLRLVDPDYAESPNGEEWEQIKVVTKFLKVFYDLTTLFSGNKYPTSNFYFDGVCQIKVLLDQETTNDIEFIRNMAKKMQEKFAKYWKKLSPILAMAVVLDPRLKFEFVEFTLEKVYPVEREMKKEVDIIRKRMAALYKEYHTASTLRGSTTTNETQNSGTVNGGNSGLNGSAFMKEFAAAKKNGGQQSDKSELEQYLS